MNKRILAAAVLSALSSVVHGAALELEEVTIVGSKEDARVLQGTGSVIDSQQMQIEAARDINQMLKTVPGI